MNTWYGMRRACLTIPNYSKINFFFFFLSSHVLMPLLGLNWVPTESIPATIPQYNYFLMPRKKKKKCVHTYTGASLVVQRGKESAYNVGDWGLILRLQRYPGEGSDKSAPVFLSGESPWTEEPGGLQSIGLQWVEHDWVTHSQKKMVLVLHILICIQSIKIKI